MVLPVDVKTPRRYSFSLGLQRAGHILNWPSLCVAGSRGRELLSLSHRRYFLASKDFLFKFQKPKQRTSDIKVEKKPSEPKSPARNRQPSVPRILTLTAYDIRELAGRKDKMMLALYEIYGEKTEQKLRTHARKLVALNPPSSLQQIQKLGNI